MLCNACLCPFDGQPMRKQCRVEAVRGVRGRRPVVPADRGTGKQRSQADIRTQREWAPVQGPTDGQETPCSDRPQPGPGPERRSSSAMRGPVRTHPEPASTGCDELRGPAEATAKAALRRNRGLTVQARKGVGASESPSPPRSSLRGGAGAEVAGRLAVGHLRAVTLSLSPPPLSSPLHSPPASHVHL